MVAAPARPALTPAPDLEALFDGPSPVHDVLGWVDDVFEGDLRAAAAEAAQRAEARGLISGPLWESIGVRVVMSLYQQRRIHAGRKAWKPSPRAAAADGDGDGGGGGVETPAALPDPTRRGERIYVEWVYLNGHYYVVGDMTKRECLAAADDYAGRAKANNRQRAFFQALADGMKNQKQTVRQAFSPAAILRIKEEAQA